jgi:DNA polymerase-3 subunit alpha
MKPNKFEDIIALVALYRPGPMSNIAIYNQCKHKQKEPDYLHPKLKKILEPTYGVIIYQEQIMQIAQTLSGFSAGEADILRRAVGKKKRKELEKQKEKFIDGAVNNGIEKDIAAFIFKKILPFAEYGFNKSHAAAYAMIAYQTAYLKTYYTKEFIAASMSHELSNTDKLSEFFEDLKRLKIKVHPPCINNCFAEFLPKDDIIYYALGAIKSVGLETISLIVKERETNGKFKSLSDFITRVNPKHINKLQLEALVKSGAFDRIFKNRKKIYNYIPNIIQISKNLYENKIANQESLFSDDSQKISYIIKDDDKDTWTNDEKLSNEFNSIGFYISDHPLNEYKDILSIYKFKTYSDFIKSDDIEGHLAGTIMQIQYKKTSKGNSFAIIKFTDQSSVFELFIFSELLEQNRNNLIEGESFLITVCKDKKNVENRMRLSVRKMIYFKNLVSKSYDQVYIEIEGSKNFNKLSEKIKEKGEAKIKVFITDTNKNYLFELKEKRKFNYDVLKSLNKEQYIKKITV